MKNCLFCNIIKGKVFAYKIYEDDFTLCFLDKKPASRGHSLVIPKEHFENIYDINEENLEKILNTIKKVTFILKEKLGCEGINILHASGEVAQQSIPHFHFHILPRYRNDGLDAWPKIKYKKIDLKKVFEDIKS